LHRPCWPGVVPAARIVESLRSRTHAAPNAARRRHRSLVTIGRDLLSGASRSRQWLGAIPAARYLGRVSKPTVHIAFLSPASSPRRGRELAGTGGRTRLEAQHCPRTIGCQMGCQTGRGHPRRSPASRSTLRMWRGPGVSNPRPSDPKVSHAHRRAIKRSRPTVGRPVRWCREQFAKGGRCQKSRTVPMQDGRVLWMDCTLISAVARPDGSTGSMASFGCVQMDSCGGH